jgi:hypothetical protein
MSKYLLTMGPNINAYAIVEAANEEEAMNKGVDSKFDCNLSQWTIVERIVSVVPFYYRLHRCGSDRCSRIV